MSLRALGSLLTRRRFSPRVQAQAEAESSRGIFTQATAGRSARSLRALRDLAVGDGGAYGVVATIALAGLATILYFNESTDKSGEGQGTSCKVCRKKASSSQQPAGEEVMDTIPIVEQVE
ncbi:uncharacterized protein LOC127773020 [Oryza glaberrima]|uniref:uncharacterized protein LOC127773020 n=1 Tax=Oryza glaberrima TaxID=4538 RepID=UPI00224BF936|nr:uncharacterized protein LOC127773020 [Oryza glaberrima]